MNSEYFSVFLLRHNVNPFSILYGIPLDIINYATSCSAGAYRE